MLNLFQKANSEKKQPENSIYDIQINSLSQKAIDLKAFRGKHILFVNVASNCGFTSQYKDLQKLYETYTDKLVVIGVPCNQFGNQEPGDASEIETFCEVNYGVSFLITEKVNVKGPQQHPLYQWLTNEKKNGVKNTKVRWNFQKYLVDDEGFWVDYFYSNTSPSSSKITRRLK
jgi:glutathione peroxidase